MKATSKGMLALVTGLATATLCACRTGDPAAKGIGSEHPAAIAFREEVKPLFSHRCAHCHNDQKPAAGLNFQDRKSVVDPAGRFVVPGQPERSRVYLAVTQPNTHPSTMPGDGWGITEQQTKALELWIRKGAPWPSGLAGKIRPKSYRVELDDYL